MKNTVRWYLILSTTLIMLISTGCLQSANSEDLPNLDSRIESSPTPQPTIQPTYTDFPTWTPPPTVDAQFAQPTVDTGGFIIATTDPFAPPTTDPFAAPTQELAAGYIEATRIVAEATQASLDLTATAIGPIQQLPTFTPTTDPFAAPTFAQPTVPGSNCVHEIRPNENLYQLSMKYGVTVYDLARASGIPESTIEFVLIGQKITIPACGTTGAVPPPTSTVVPVANATPIPGVNTSDGFATTAPVFSGRTHFVRQHETLYIIAQQYGITVDDILRVNPEITDPNNILFNRSINIP